ncbi:hypothetical protein PRIPAC_80911 [Pristionchus pacificus]|uniref:Amino acid transporter n=1 Tax=Pristionchus pacificus TaxID=54126 RepID=A0A2A6CPV5_PRIPA|nr:hypothetical protein PRIPAC_80911 [Pristionchus pacificus]|eukprot:PDM80071.1 hypothetical protein PRIPAC_32650 [Pristionchus pacificus]
MASDRIAPSPTHQPHVTVLSVDTALATKQTVVSSPTNTSSTSSCKSWNAIKDNLLLVLTVSSVVAGIVLGLVLRSVNLSPIALQLINFPGEIFMQVLKMMVLPLIFTSIISSLSQMESGNAGKMGLMTVAYYATTAVIASATGIFFVTMIAPGTSTSLPHSTVMNTLSTGDVEPIDTFLDLFRNMFPDNIFKATFQRVNTKYDHVNGTLVKDVVDGPGTNILGVLVFCVFFGLVTSKLGDKVRIVIDFFIALDMIIMGWIHVLMWFAPVGILSLISGNLLDVEDLAGTFQVGYLIELLNYDKRVETLALYVFTILLGLFTHILITTPSLFFLFTRKSPLPVYKTMLQPFAIAFGTASSGAALPTSISCLEEMGVDSRIANFVPPLGNTINVVRRLVTMVLILNTVGLPIKDLSLIVTVDWLIDRIRTAINVMGDGFATCIIAHNVDVDLKEEEGYRSIDVKPTIEEV